MNKKEKTEYGTLTDDLADRTKKGIRDAYESIYAEYIRCRTKANEKEAKGSYHGVTYYKQQAHGCWFALMVMEHHIINRRQ